jgi:hypothetical protein
MANKGGKRRRSHGLKFLVARHGRMSRQDADTLERTIEKRERRHGRQEIAEQLADSEILPPVSPE